MQVFHSIGNIGEKGKLEIGGEVKFTLVQDIIQTSSRTVGHQVTRMALVTANAHKGIDIFMIYDFHNLQLFEDILVGDRDPIFTKFLEDNHDIFNLPNLNSTLLEKQVYQFSAKIFKSKEFTIVFGNLPCLS